MKKILALLLIALVMQSVMPAIATETAEDGSVGIEAVVPVEDTIGIQRGTELVVGSTTELSGHFATDLWGSNTSDLDVRALLHGYSTIAWANADEMTIDGTVVRTLEAKQGADGSRTYTISLADGLCYNDGTPITAKDYVFSLLLIGSPEVAEVGGTPYGLGHIVGYDAYVAREQKAVSGLRLVEDHSFSITVGKDYSNYFYALAMLNVTPYPIQVIAPGCDIYDDGKGAYIGASADVAEIDAKELPYTPGQFGAIMLAETMLNPRTGYTFYPRVTSGPYALESYDPATHVARFVINEQYIGNFEGQKPHIERLEYRPVSNETMIEELAEGKVGLLNKVVNGVTLAKGMVLASEEEKAGVSNYLRTGFAFLSFACEEGVMSNLAVRKAIAHCVDNTQYVANLVGSINAMPVYGYYGLGQWMVAQTFEAEPESGKGELVVMEKLAELEVPYDLNAAKELLVEDGWTLNEAGEAYQEGVDEIRYREEGGSLVPLTIRWAKTANNPLADSTQRVLGDAFGTLGIGLEITEMPFHEMLAHYYRQEERGYDMFYLASNFGYVFDPYNEYNTGDAYQGAINTTGLTDDRLIEIAESMRETAPTAMREYTEEWLEFQTRWVELMPMVPLYSNVYFDFYSTELQDYNIQLYSNWAYAITYAWIGEPAPESETELDMEPEDMELEDMETDEDGLVEF